MPTISATTYQKFMTCPRLYFFESVCYLERAREDGARRFGKLYHAGLEHWWRAMDGGDVPWRDADAALVAALKGVADDARHINTDPFEVARAEAMLTVYHARYFELEFESVYGADGGDGVEQWFKMPLRYPEGDAVVSDWFVVGRKDAIKRFADGRVKPTEHKTSNAHEIHGASDYWSRLAIDTQISIYIDAARFAGHGCDRVLYDVSRKPGNRPLRATLPEARKMTKGKGCPHCGGRAGGKNGAAQGAGKIIIRTQVDADGLKLPKAIDVETTCVSCNGTGWHDVPRLQTNQRKKDEDVSEFKARVLDELMSDPDAHFRMGDIVRTDEQIMAMRHDLFMVTGLIGSMRSMSSGYNTMREERACWPRNTNACLSVYGARCDFLDVCNGAVPNPFESPLYRIKPKPTNRQEPTQLNMSA